MIGPDAPSVCPRCDWLTADGTLRDGNQPASNMKKKSILLVLPDVLMFNMRVLYYNNDYDYSCAILVYCGLNVTLFFYDMLSFKKKLKTLGFRTMASFKSVKLVL